MTGQFSSFQLDRIGKPGALRLRSGFLTLRLGSGFSTEATPTLTSEATQPTTGKLSCHELSRMETEKLEALPPLVTLEKQAESCNQTEWVETPGRGF